MSDPIQTPATPAAPREKPEEPLDSEPHPELDSPREEQPAEKEGTRANAENLQVNLQNLTDSALRFLATASNETLGACLVGLGATTYIILGRVGLVLMGVVGGVVLHATWEGSIHGREEDTKSGEPRRREAGVDVAHRVLEWRDTIRMGGKQGKSEDDESNTDVKLYSGESLDYSEFRPDTAAALTELTDAVIRDYVKWWYSPILPGDDSFPTSCRQTLTAFILSVSGHLSRKRPADAFLDFVTHSSSIMIVFFNELAAALAVSPSDPVPDAIDAYLEMKPESHLAHVLDNKIQAQKLGIIAEDILQNYLEAKTYNCRPAHTFLRQVLAKVVLEMTLTSCSKPEWINGWIVYMLEEGEPELMNAIDAGVDGGAGELKASQTGELGGGSLGEASPEQKSAANHKRVVSKAQEAMDEAMKEAQRLSAMIAEEDAKRIREQQAAPNSSPLHDDRSESTTQGIMTPTSSQSEALAEHDAINLGLSRENLGSLQPSPVAQEEQHKPVFTSFDQLVPVSQPTALLAHPSERPPPLTLHNCNVAIFDDSMPGEKATIKSKPTVEYLIQVEPSSHHHSGWMTARKMTDFETLHEILRRIAPVTGATGFMEAHATLPPWKGHTKASLRGELERYLNDAVKFKPLAESEGMKRFLEKDTGLGKSPGKSGFSGMWPGQTFENMGKGMIDVLTKAPKEVAGGGKALLGGVTGVLGSVASPLVPKRNSASISNSTSSLNRSTTALASTPPTTRHGRAESTVSELPTHIRTESTMSSMSSFTKRPSTDSLRSPHSPIIDQQPGPVAQMDRRPSYQEGDGKRSGRSSLYGTSRSNSRAPSVRNSVDLPSGSGDQFITLPPLPSEIRDDYTGSPTDPFHFRHESRASTSSLPLPPETAPPLPARRPSATSLASNQPSTKQPPKPKSHASLTEQETTVLIELFFAVINELYTLSSAWQIRRTLLNAAKTFLLRPGNPQLESIRQLIQSTLLDENLSDSGIAYHIRNIRANSLPTEEEQKSWPRELSKQEKEKLRVKARRLLVERGMPQALTSVMGNAASGEALGRVFDCLQVERVSRGMVFGLLLQGLRAVVQ